MRILYVHNGTADPGTDLTQLQHHLQISRWDALSGVREAVERLDRSAADYDLVLVDLDLTATGSLALLARIRERNWPLAVVVLAGAGDEDMVISALRSGADDYVVKSENYVERLPGILTDTLRRRQEEHTRRERPLRVLYAEDSEMDADLTVQHMIRHAPYIQLDIVGTSEAVFERLASEAQIAYDLLLIDYRLPGTNALRMLRELRRMHKIEIPVVLVTGQGDEEVARQAVRLGVVDYVVKSSGYLFKLPLVLENAFHRTQLAQESARLRQSEARYRDLVELAPNVIVTMDANGIVTLCNSAFFQASGLASQQVIGRHFTDFLPPADGDRYREMFSQALVSGGHGSLEFRWIHADGAMHWGEAHVRAIEDQRQVKGFQIVITDVTHRKRTEQLLQVLGQAALALERALTLDQIFVSVAAEFAKLELSCAVFFLDDQGFLVPQHLSYSPATIRRLEKLSGAKVSRFKVAVNAVGEFQSAIHSRQAVFVQDTEHVVRQMLPLHLRGLARLIVRILNVPRFIVAPLVVEGRVAGLVSVQAEHLVQDDLAAIMLFAHQMAATLHRAQLYERAQQEIAERKRIEEALREREERFRALVQDSSDVIVVIDAQGLMHYVSPAVERALGATPAELLGRDAFSFVHPEDIGSVREVFVEVLQHPGQPYVHEFRLRHVDGSWVSVETVTNNLLGNPSVQGIVINGRDIGERRRLEMQFRQAQKMEAVGRLAGGIAHDFNNLLTAMQGYTELLLGNLSGSGPVDERTRQAMRSDLNEVKQAADRAAALTHQLLAFSRKQMLQPRMVDLNALVCGIQNMLQRLIGEDIVLRTELAPALGRVLADPGQIEQVILNLVVNARDAMPQGGQVILETANVSLNEAFVRTHPGSQTGKYVMLAVTDTGVGMNEEVRSHLFEPFFTTKGSGKGTGLGLATVYGIVKQSGGYIWPQSEQGKGSRFEFYLPRVAAEIGVEVQEKQTPSLPRGGETILLVEDEDIVRQLAQRILSRQGYRVLEARHPDEALQLTMRCQDRIDLLITDVVMPGMGGRELAERLSAWRPEIKVLFVSGYTDDAIVQHDISQEQVNFVQKPFTPQGLIRRVREILDNQVA